MNISKRQRQILLAMREVRCAFIGASEMRGFYVRFRMSDTDPDVPDTARIYAYQQPEWHMMGRGFIERYQSNEPGAWYKLTPKGAEIAARLAKGKDSREIMRIIHA